MSNKKHEALINKLDGLFNSCDAKDLQEATKLISEIAETAYIQGAKDAKGIYTSEGKPAYAEGFDFQEMQLPAIASLYAKEQGFKP